MSLAGGLLLAVLSSGFFATSYAYQHHSLSTGAKLALTHPLSGIRQLLGSPRWLVGYLSSWVGWGVYIAALSLAPLSLVQAANAGAIGPLALLSPEGDSRRSRRERRGAVVSVLGLLLVLATVHADRATRHPSSVTVLVVVGAGLSAFALLGLVAPERSRGVALGIGSGLCYGVGDVATKAAVLGEAGLVPVFLVCAALGFLALQLSYQRASLLQSAGLSCLFTNAVPIACGVILFGESPLGTPLQVLRGVGFAAVVVGAVVLAGSRPAQVTGAGAVSAQPSAGIRASDDESH